MDRSSHRTLHNIGNKYALGTKRKKMFGKNNPFYGKKHSESSLKKMSISHKKHLKKHPRKTSWNKGLKQPEHSKFMMGNKYSLIKIKDNK